MGNIYIATFVYWKFLESEWRKRISEERHKRRTTYYFNINLKITTINKPSVILCQSQYFYNNFLVGENSLVIFTYKNHTEL